ncbi:hypothetical protein [Planotetraspora phitsanulokensis]|uniref:hypothetical protein n=1 Tax=Planotetraspora phitsanulokensis TaxID=575192 RepID=UPI0019505967|nr:hypothetical protein [Planotetraspora phitsanulokensis]
MLCVITPRLTNPSSSYDGGDAGVVDTRQMIVDHAVLINSDIKSDRARDVARS